MTEFFLKIFNKYIKLIPWQLKLNKVNTEKLYHLLLNVKVQTLVLKQYSNSYKATFYHHHCQKVTKSLRLLFINKIIIIKIIIISNQSINFAMCI